MKAIGSFCRSLLALLAKEIRDEYHSREFISLMLLYSLTIIVIFNYALDVEKKQQADTAAGILWVALTFSGILSISRSVGKEKENACLDSLLIAPVERIAIFLGKSGGILLFSLAVSIFFIPIYSVLYQVNFLQPGLIPVLLLGLYGFSLTGTLLTMMAAQTRTRDVLLPILLLPVLFPLLLSAVKATGGIMQTLPQEEIQPWLNILIGYDLLFSGIGIIAFEYITLD